MNELPNPYIAGNPLTGSEMFFGREDIFAFIRQALTGQHQDHVLVIYGQRRTGKTSVLYQMHRHLDPRYLPLFIDLHGLALDGLGGFLQELANHIIRGLKNNYRIQLSPIDRDEFKVDPRQYFESTFLEQVWEEINDRHLLLMLDEAVRLEEQIEAGKLEPDVFSYLRHLMQHHPLLNFLFSLGSGLEEMEKDYAFLFNVALYKKISFLDKGSSIRLITKPVEDIYQFESKAVEHILDITSGHPYYTQLICHGLFNACTKKSITKVGVSDVDSVLDEAVERGLAVLKHVWEESNAAEKATLAGLASVSKDSLAVAGEAEIIQAWSTQEEVITVGDIAGGIKNLIARDVITGDTKYRFTVDLQRMWILKYRRLDWVKEEIKDWLDSVPDSESPIDALTTTPPSIPFYRNRKILIPLTIITPIILIIIFILWNASIIGIPSLDMNSDLVQEIPDDVVAYSSEGNTLATGGSELITIWSLPEFDIVRTIESGEVDINDLLFSNGGEYLAAPQEDGEIYIYNIREGSEKRLGNEDLSGGIEMVAWNPDDTLLASISSHNQVQLWDTTSWERIKQFNAGPIGGFSNAQVAFNADGSLLMTGSEEGISLWSVKEKQMRDLELPLDLELPQFDGDALAASPIDPGLFASSNGLELYLWRIGRQRFEGIFKIDSGSIDKLLFSPDGKMVAAIDDEWIKFYSLIDANLHHTITDLSGVDGIKFSPDSDLVAIDRRYDGIEIRRIPQVVSNVPSPTIGVLPEIVFTSVLPETPKPSKTLTPTFTPIANFTSTESHTSTPTNTVAPSQIPIIVASNSRCRTGPGIMYPISAYLNQGESIYVEGRIFDTSWIFIVKANTSEACWVNSTLLNIDGEFDVFKVMTPPPTPVITSSPTPTETKVKSKPDQDKNPPTPPP